MEDELMALALRCEQATAGEQRSILEEAWSAIYPGLRLPAPGAYWPPRLTGFVKMLDAEAFESSALSLVPEGYMLSGASEGEDGRYCVALFPRDPESMGIPRIYEAHVAVLARMHGAAFALAITAAALKARATLARSNEGAGK